MVITKKAMSNADRKGAVAALAKLAGKVADGDDFIWISGKYIIAHYELVNTTDKGKELDRSKAYKVLEGTSGRYLGGSVYAFPVLPGKSAELVAAEIWNSVQTLTEGLLVAGDLLFVHYSGKSQNQLGVIAQTVPAGKTSFHRVDLPRE